MSFDDDDDDISSTLKEIKDLDALDAELYSPKQTPKKETKTDVKSTIAPSASKAKDLDDFDEDLDDLFSDDEDGNDPLHKTEKSTKASEPDSFSLSSSPKSNVSKGSPLRKATSSSIKQVFTLDSSPDVSPETERANKKPTSDEQTAEKLASGDSDFSRTGKNNSGISSIFANESDLPSPKKKIDENKTDSFKSEETTFLDELGLGKLDESKLASSTKVAKKKIISPEKKKSSIPKMDDVFSDDDGDVLDNFGKANKTQSPKKTKNTLMDDLFANPKETKKLPPKNISALLEGNAKDDDDDNFAFSLDNRDESSKRKSVKFEDEFQPSLLSTGDKVLPRRRQQTNPKKKEDPFDMKPASKKIDDDDDWLGLLKKTSKTETPTKSPTTLPKENPEAKNNPNMTRRKSSSADWLGLQESPQLSPMASPKTPTRQPLKEDKIDGIELNSSIGSSRRGQLPWLSDTPSRRGSIPKEIQSPPSKKPLETPKPTSAPTTRNQNPTHNYAENAASQLPVNNVSAPQLAAVPAVMQNVSAPQLAAVPAVMQNVSPAVMQNAVPAVMQNVSPAVMQNAVPTVVQNTVPAVMPSAVPYTPLPQISSFVPPQTYAIPSAHRLHNEQMDFLALQTMLNSLQFERDQLLKSIEEMKKKQEEDIKVFQTTLDDQKKSIEETFERKFKNVGTEHESDLQNIKRQLAVFEEEKKRSVAENHARIENLEKDYKQQMDKLKDLHNEAVSLMKRDHEEALNRLRILKDREIEAITSTETHARSLRALTDQLEARTSEIASLQVKVDEKHQMALQERQAALSAKEKELKALEGRLRWQTEDGEQERSRLQQLVLRMETRLQQQTKDGEEDRWEVQQRKAKLEVHQKYLEEEKKMHLEVVEKEKERLHSFQDSLLREQKNLLMQLAEERQQTMIEKRELESLARRFKDEESKFNIRRMKEESTLVSQRHALEYEENKLRVERGAASQESQQLYIERQTLEREKRQLKDDKEAAENTKMMLKRQSQEVEEMTLRSAADKEEAKTHLAIAQKIESSHHTKMNEFTRQMQALMEKEKDLAKEKEKLADYKRDLEEKRSSMLCSSCKIAIGLPMTELPANLHQFQHHQLHSPAYIPAVANMQAHPATVDPSLMVWYVTAQKDREYLQEQINFLQSMKGFHKNMK